MSENECTFEEANDRFRTSLGIGCGLAGKCVVTPSVDDLDEIDKEIFYKVFDVIVNYNQWEDDEDGDVEDHHEMGLFSVDQRWFIWKIDCYTDSSCEYIASDRFINPTKCYRVMTVMLQSEN